MFEENKDTVDEQTVEPVTAEETPETESEAPKTETEETQETV